MANPSAPARWSTHPLYTATRFVGTLASLIGAIAFRFDPEVVAVQAELTAARESSDGLAAAKAAVSVAMCSRDIPHGCVQASIKPAVSTTYVGTSLLQDLQGLIASCGQIRVNLIDINVRRTWLARHWSMYSRSCWSLNLAMLTMIGSRGRGLRGTGTCTRAAAGA